MVRKTVLILLILMISSFIFISMASADGPSLSFTFNRKEYHPGDLVSLTAYLSSPIVTNLTLEIKEPDDDLFLVLTNQTNEDGITSISFILGADAEIGNYRIYVAGNTSQGVVENQTSFSVSQGYTPLKISSSDITSSKINPANNENITLYALAHNLGNISILAAVSFYEGDPNTDGILIDSTNLILPAKGSEIAKIDYTATDGLHFIYVVLETEGFPSTSASRIFNLGQGAEPILEISTAGGRVFEFEPGKERIITVDVTCNLQTVNNVHLVVLDNQGLTINASITSPRILTAGETAVFQLRIKAPELPEGTDNLERNILIQVVGDDGVFSDAETLTILVERSKEDQFDPMIIVFAMVVLILIGIVVISFMARKSGNDTRNKIIEHLRTNPGSSLNEIQVTLETKNGALSRHIKKLEKEGFIVSKKMDKLQRFYPKIEEDLTDYDLDDLDDEEI